MSTDLRVLTRANRWSSMWLIKSASSRQGVSVTRSQTHGRGSYRDRWLGMWFASRPRRSLAMPSPNSGQKVCDDDCFFLRSHHAWNTNADQTFSSERNWLPRKVRPNMFASQERHRRPCRTKSSLAYQHSWRLLFLGKSNSHSKRRGEKNCRHEFSKQFAVCRINKWI